MRFNPEIHHRRSIRLKGYDYSKPGVYFITICSYNRMILFNHPRINAILKEEWLKLVNRFGIIKLDEFIIMPNHVHGIIIIKNTDHDCKCDLSAIIQAYKSITMFRYLKSEIIEKVDMPVKLWQRNYYDHIIKNKNELQAIRLYIKNNPLNWRTDPDNPENLKK